MSPPSPTDADISRLTRDLARACLVEGLEPEAFRVAVSIQLFSKPFSELIDTSVLDRVPEPMHTVVAIVLFDTVLAMEGLLTTLGNSSGHHMPLFADALERIDSHGDAGRVRTVLAILAEHGTSPRRLRETAVQREQYAVTTFAATHPDQPRAFSARISAIDSAISDDHSDDLARWLGARWVELRALAEGP